MSKKILIVDDEPDVVRVIGMRLKKEGYSIISASDGMTGTQMAVQEQPDMIILDVGMPAGDGHTVAARLRKNNKTLGIPILFVSARAAESERAKAIAAGAVGYLTKPYKPSELLGYVRMALVPA